MKKFTKTNTYSDRYCYAFAKKSAWIEEVDL